MSGPCDRRQHIEPLPIALLASPLDYILSDHLRQRVLFHLCDQIAEADWLDGALVEEVRGFIARDMAVHVIDEEQDLFPLLRRRAHAEDDIEAALGKLSGQHADDERLAEEIVAGLDRALDAPSAPLPDALRSALRLFAHNQRHHLALENATVMPLARVRLKGHDLAELSARMAARRGFLVGDDGTPRRP